jgi:hypothetical protein
MLACRRVLAHFGWKNPVFHKPTKSLPPPISAKSLPPYFFMKHLLLALHCVDAPGSANFITTADCRSGYWQLPVRPEDRWLTAFAYDGGCWKWTRLPFGFKTSGNSFVRCVQMILNPVRDFSFSFLDDLSVCSDSWGIFT